MTRFRLFIQIYKKKTAIFVILIKECNFKLTDGLSFKGYKGKFLSTDKESPDKSRLRHIPMTVSLILKL